MTPTRLPRRPWSRTFVEVRRRLPDGIGIAGWSLSRDCGAVRSFEGEVVDGVGRATHVQVGPPSDDVAAAQPGVQGPDRSRFEFAIGIEDADVQGGTFLSCWSGRSSGARAGRPSSFSTTRCGRRPPSWTGSADLAPRAAIVRRARGR